MYYEPNQMQRIPASVSAFGKAKPSKFGEGLVQSIKIVSDSGETSCWKTLPAAEARNWSIGDRLVLLPTQRGGAKYLRY